VLTASIVRAVSKLRAEKLGKILDKAKAWLDQAVEEGNGDRTDGAREPTGWRRPSLVKEGREDTNM
jgi:hypothetical protein